jgi:hypothetical protein
MQTLQIDDHVIASSVSLHDLLALFIYLLHIKINRSFFYIPVYWAISILFIVDILGVSRSKKIET